jgi:hypothetical protein
MNDAIIGAHGHVMWPNMRSQARNVRWPRQPGALSVMSGIDVAVAR